MSSPPSIDPRLIAPCGMNCALCLGFQRTRDRCAGCRGEGGYMPRYCLSCIIRNCPTISKEGTHFCYECGRMPCKRLKQLDARYRSKYGMSMIDNLMEMKEEGMDTFLARQAESYTCPSCGGMLCVHRSRCLTCDPKGR